MPKQAYLLILFPETILSILVLCCLTTNLCTISSEHCIKDDIQLIPWIKEKLLKFVFLKTWLHVVYSDWPKQNEKEAKNKMKSENRVTKDKAKECKAF